MDYIKDKDIYKAVMYAKKLLSYGKSIFEACGIASRTYNKNFEEVRKYVAQPISGKRKITTKGIKYKFYIEGEFRTWDNEDSGVQRFNEKAHIKKAKENTINYINNTHIFTKEFDIKKEAEEYLQNNFETIMTYFRQYQWG